MLYFRGISWQQAVRRNITTTPWLGITIMVGMTLIWPISVWAW